jgi:RNA polymerase subunit RPABC4/transcription elongation factor Spt4
VPRAPEISQGNPLAQSKFGAVKFCMGCGTGIPGDLTACPKCGKPTNAPTPEAMRIHGEPAAASSPAAAFKGPQYCRTCGTAMKSGTPKCPKCGKPMPAPA